MEKANAAKLKSLIWICLLLLITMMGMSVTAQAATETIPNGDYTIAVNGIYQLPEGYSGTITIGNTVTEATVTDAVYKASHTWTSITVESGRSAALELTIEDIDITAPDGIAGIDLRNLVSDENILYISGTSNVTGGNGIPGMAGIYVPDGVGVIIDEAPSSEGAQLTATGVSGAAGIGGGSRVSGGNITISGGTVTATGGDSGAGIGGGCYLGIGGTITISGGIVTANGGDSGAGIGGSCYRDSGNITISGGAVTATSGYNAAGIGGGYSGSGGNVIITGSPIVYATGDIYGGAEQIGAGLNGSRSGTLKDTTDADLSYIRFSTEGIAGVEIELEGIDGEYLTNNQGIYGIFVPRSGTVTYTVSKAGYERVQGTQTVSQMNHSVYITMVADNAPPIVSDGTITISNRTETGTTLTWNKASDLVSAEEDLQYIIYMSEEDNLNTVEEIEANGTVVQDYTADIETLDITGLQPGRTYYFNVIVMDEAGNKIAYTVTAASPITYTVTFDSMSGSSVESITGVTYGSTITAPSAPTRPGYIFSGWYKEVSYVNAWNFSTDTVSGDITLYARWANNDSSDDEDSSESRTTATPTYKADISGAGAMGTTLPINVNTNMRSATTDLGNVAGNIFSGTGTAAITIPPIPGVSSYTLEMPASILSGSQGEGALTFSTGTGSITIPDNMLAELPGTDGKKAGITIGLGDKSSLSDELKTAIDDRPLVQLILSLDGVQTQWNNPNAPVTVSIPYTPTAAELSDPECIVVWYIDGSGNVVSVPNGHYDAATGMVTFKTTHFSDYAVVYNKVSFNDVAPDAWYKEAVGFIAAREIAGGTGNGNYSPEAKLTRGDFLVLLMNAYAIAPDNSPADNFSDADSTYYTGYLASAKRLGISTGIGNNMFAPDKHITRQEMFTLMYNALKAINQLPQGTKHPDGSLGKALSDYDDAGQIDLWAKEAMKLFVEIGTIGGNAGKLMPTGMTTRAEMAQVLYNLLSWKDK